jgi:hypothetical protein
MVEVGSKVDNPFGFVGGPNTEDGIRTGKVVSISDQMTYFGFHTFMFDSSLVNEDILKKVHDHYAQYVGKIVYWPERSESGTIIKDGDTEYAFIKMSSVMAVESDEQNS